MNGNHGEHGVIVHQAAGKENDRRLERLNKKDETEGVLVEGLLKSMSHAIMVHAQVYDDKNL